MKETGFENLPSIASVISGGGIGGVSLSGNSAKGCEPNNFISSGCTLTLPP